MTKVATRMISVAAAGALAVVAATPTLARDTRGIDSGDVIAGALVLGGIAAIAAAASDNDSSGYGYRNGRDRAYGWGGADPRAATAQCARAVEDAASRYGRGRADVTQIRNVIRKQGGYNVSGRVAVEGRGDGWRGNGWRRDRYDNRSDTGTFTCKVRYGRVTDLDFSGIRGLR